MDRAFDRACVSAVQRGGALVAEDEQAVRAARRNRKALALACSSVLASLGIPALAQSDPAESRGTIKIEVTGSHIPQSEVESALPVQVITREDILRSGATSVAEVMAHVSANVLGMNNQLSVGNAIRPGMASVNLRGVGDGSTLVLINGRRVANYAFDGGAVDINSIPFSAIERIEILKDGASAIYGTDAIAGVVNFILRKDYRGAETTIQGDWTQHGGGNQMQATVAAGYGDLAKDRYNAFVTANYQKNDALAAAQRPFSSTGYLPDAGINELLPWSLPANFLPVDAPRLFNPFYATGCTPPATYPSTLPPFPGVICGFDGAHYVDDIPRTERTTMFGRATFQASPDHELFAEAGYSHNRLTSTTAPTPVFSLPQYPFVYPVSGPYYPAEFAAANGFSGDLVLQYRTVPLGPRVNDVDTSAWRVVAGAQGMIADWSYGTALTYSRNDQTDSFGNGYVSRSRLHDALLTGLINPFGPSGPDGDALLNGTRISGKNHIAKGTTLDFDVRASKDVLKLAGGPLAVAIGAEARREKLENQFTSLVTDGDVLGYDAFDLQSVAGSRNVQALFVEANVPIASGLETQLAARYDHYSDFGNTVNPKIALRWQPVKTLLLRASFGTGFRAPTLYDLYTPATPGFVGEFDDPLRCPVTMAQQDCGSFFRAVQGGNPNLAPEKSKQFNAGVVWAPATGLSFAVDYWDISKTNVVGTLSPDAIFNDLARFGPTNVIRGPVQPAYPDLPGPIELVVLKNQNLGNLRTSGIDVAVDWKGTATAIGRFSFAVNGTYIMDWKMQPQGLDYESGVGRNSPDIPGPFPRWKHYAALGWNYGPWSATLAQTYQSGYEDSNPPDDRYQVPPRHVSSYEVWDLHGTYTGFEHTTIAVGVKNLFDRDPPFTNQPFSFQVGYDPKYADPRGRTFYASVTYAFK